MPLRIAAPALLLLIAFLAVAFYLNPPHGIANVSPRVPPTGLSAHLPPPPPPPPPDLTPAVTAAAQLPRMRSLLVSRRGELILERYFNGARASHATNIKSASKSVISALVGIAIHRDLISGVDAPIGSFFPDYLASKTHAAKREITVEDLLTMRSGLRSTSGRGYGAWVQSSNWVKYVLDRPLISPPGASMEYSTGNSHLLSAILTRATGDSTWTFARNHLAGPLGITLPPWDRDPQGIYLGGNNMVMTPRQMLAFGELYRNRGRANGRQIVPESWVETSFIPRGRSHWSHELHGYGWWIGELAGQKTYYAWGFGGQLIFILPSLDLTVVTTSSPATGETRRSHRRTVLTLIERHVIAPHT